MPIDFSCPHCGKQTVVADKYAGHTGPCVACGRSISVPTSVRGNSNDPNSLVNPYTDPMQVERASVHWQGHENGSGVRMLLPVDRSGVAIVAGYCGLFALLVFPAPLALGLGIWALFDIRKSKGRKHGLGRAWFAIIMGILGLVGPIALALTL